MSQNRTRRKAAKAKRREKRQARRNRERAARSQLLQSLPQDDGFLLPDDEQPVQVSSYTTDEPALLCPVCGWDYLHPVGVSAWMRNEDEVRPGIDLRLSSEPTPLPPEWNPSARRQGIILEFTCEGCHNPYARDENDQPVDPPEPYRLVFNQHKGQTWLQWDVRQPTFLDDHPPAP